LLTKEQCADKAESRRCELAHKRMLGGLEA